MNGHARLYEKCLSFFYLSEVIAFAKKKPNLLLKLSRLSFSKKGEKLMAEELINRTIGDVLDETAEKHPDNDALVYVDRGLRLSLIHI